MSTGLVQGSTVARQTLTAALQALAQYTIHVHVASALQQRSVGSIARPGAPHPTPASPPSLHVTRSPSIDSQVVQSTSSTPPTSLLLIIGILVHACHSTP
jgi:hypothetical protein